MVFSKELCKQQPSIGERERGRITGSNAAASPGRSLQTFRETKLISKRDTLEGLPTPLSASSHHVRVPPKSPGKAALNVFHSTSWNLSCLQPANPPLVLLHAGRAVSLRTQSALCPQVLSVQAATASNLSSVPSHVGGWPRPLGPSGAGQPPARLFQKDHVEGKGTGHLFLMSLGTKRACCTRETKDSPL